MKPESPPIKAVISRRWLVLGALALAAVLAYTLRYVLVPLLLAFLLAYALSPVVGRLVRLRVPRSIAAISTVLSVVAVVVGTLVLAVPVVVEQFSSATADMPEKTLAIRHQADVWVWDHMRLRMPATTTEWLFRVHEELRSRGLNVVDGVGTAVGDAFNAIVLWVGVFIVPVFAIYLLIDFDAVVERAQRIIPRRYLPVVSDVVGDVHRNLGRYVQGQLTTNVVLATLYAGGLTAVGIPLAIPIGILTGMFAVVPYIGFMVGFILALAMAILEWQGVWPVLGVVGVMGTVQILDATIITPRIVGGAVGLKPLEVLLTMMVAGTLLGFFGVLLAVPLGAVVKILVRHLFKAYFASEYYLRLPAPHSVPSAYLPADRTTLPSAHPESVHPPPAG